MPQLFVKRESQEFPVLIFAKVVDDFLSPEHTSELHLFHEQISRRFPVGRLTLNNDLILYSLRIICHKNSSITVYMQEYMEKISPIFLPVVRKRFHLPVLLPLKLKRFKSMLDCSTFLVMAFYHKRPF